MKHPFFLLVTVFCVVNRAERVMSSVSKAMSSGEKSLRQHAQPGRKDGGGMYFEESDVCMGEDCKEKKMGCAGGVCSTKKGKHSQDYAD